MPELLEVDVSESDGMVSKVGEDVLEEVWVPVDEDGALLVPPALDPPAQQPGEEGVLYLATGG